MVLSFFRFKFFALTKVFTNVLMNSISIMSDHVFNKVKF